jgi:hypothetical protein
LSGATGPTVSFGEKTNIQCLTWSYGNVVEFKYEKIAPRIYKVMVPRLNMGEYGFLAPGAVATANAASQGKIYTFHIVE